jgi:hypothetical protein
VSSKLILYIGLTLIGAVCAFLNGWVFLLDSELQPLLLTGVGILIMIAGVVNIRRERSANRNSKT